MRECTRSQNHRFVNFNRCHRGIFWQSKNHCFSYTLFSITPIAGKCTCCLDKGQKAPARSRNFRSPCLEIDSLCSKFPRDGRWSVHEELIRKGMYSLWSLGSSSLNFSFIVVRDDLWCPMAKQKVQEYTKVLLCAIHIAGLLTIPLIRPKFLTQQFSGCGPELPRTPWTRVGAKLTAERLYFQSRTEKGEDWPRCQWEGSICCWS